MKKIMVVDDEKEIRSFYKDVLIRNGYNVVEAEKSSSITDLLMREENIGLVLFDLRAPQEMPPHYSLEGLYDPYDILKLYDASIQVIVASVYPPGDQRKLALKADCYYDKSEDASDLLERVQMLLRLRPPFFAKP